MITCGKPENKQNKQTIMGRRDKKGGSVQDDVEKYRRYTNPFFFFHFIEEQITNSAGGKLQRQKTEAKDETVTSSPQHSAHPQQQLDCYPIQNNEIRV